MKVSDDKAMYKIFDLFRKKTLRLLENNPGEKNELPDGIKKKILTKSTTASCIQTRTSATPRCLKTWLRVE